ncbi:MAG: 2-C-methyl-D-erythritol 2,4-cyclodiphosphate synthase [Clostridiales bacterium]|nr:2-C-methyl-D-erythritol 2,4-cyclodiphosphate synthase [Clostridiales bacterium]
MMRIGHGYDVHRFESGRRLILGGVQIPYSQGLAGHSDADVLTHAVMDALLGAAGLGDIGMHFPDTDDRFEGINSLILARETVALVQDAGYCICNIDSTLIAQAPKLSPYLPQMRKALSQALQINTDQINIKATTEEHLGFTGRKEGIAAHAVCLLERTNQAQPLQL